MKVQATVTKKEQVLVDVEPEALILLIKSRLSGRGISIPDMIQLKDGSWEKYDYTHPHNNDDIYKPCDPPTETELFWIRFLEELKITLRG